MTTVIFNCSTASGHRGKLVMSLASWKRKDDYLSHSSVLHHTLEWAHHSERSLLLHLLLLAPSSIRLPTPPSTLSFPELPPAPRPAAGAARRLRAPMLGTPHLRMPTETAEVSPWTSPLHTFVFLLCLSVHTADFLLNQPPPVNQHVFNLPGAFFWHDGCICSLPLKG